MARKVANIYREASAPKRQHKWKLKLLSIVGMVVIGILCIGNLFDNDYDVNFETTKTKSTVAGNYDVNSDNNLDAGAGAPEVKNQVIKDSTDQNKNDGNPSATKEVDDPNLYVNKDIAEMPAEESTSQDYSPDQNKIDGDGDGDGDGDSDGDGDGDGDGDDVPEVKNQVIKDSADQNENDGNPSATKEVDDPYLYVNKDIAETPAEESTSQDYSPDQNKIDGDGDGDSDGDGDDVPEVKNQVIKDSADQNENDGNPSATKEVDDPDLYVNKDIAETPAEESSSQDSAISDNKMDNGYLDDMEKFKAGANATNENFESNITIGAGSAAGNNTLSVTGSDDDALLENSTVITSEGNRTDITVESVDNSTVGVINVLNDTDSNEVVSEFIDVNANETDVNATANDVNATASDVNANETASEGTIVNANETSSEDMNVNTTTIQSTNEIVSEDTDVNTTSTSQSTNETVSKGTDVNTTTIIENTNETVSKGTDVNTTIIQSTNETVSEGIDVNTPSSSLSINDTDANGTKNVPATSNGNKLNATELPKTDLDSPTNQTLPMFNSSKTNATISDSNENVTNATTSGQHVNESLEDLKEGSNNDTDANDLEQIAPTLELCESNPFVQNLELSFEDIEVEVKKIFFEQNEKNIGEGNKSIAREEEEVENIIGSEERRLGGQHRKLEQESNGDKLTTTQGANSTQSGLFSAKCKNDESSAMLPGMCGGLVTNINARLDNCEYYVAYAGTIPDDVATMPTYIKLAKFSKCKINVVSLCGDVAGVKLSTATLIGDRDLDKSVKARIVVHKDFCLDSSKTDTSDSTVEDSDSVVAQPTPLQTDMLYIDLAGSSASPSEFLTSIDSERLRLVNINDESAKEVEIYLPKQIVFSGVDEESAALDPSLQMILLLKGYVLMPGLGPLSLMRILCPEPPSMGGSASFVAAGFPM